jgi:hypothetical protein
MSKVAHIGGDDNVDRLSRVADMLTNAVDLLTRAMEEIKTERGPGDDDGDASGAPDRNPEQPR